MNQTLSTKIFIFRTAEADNTTKKKYLLALAKDIYLMREQLCSVWGTLWSNSLSDMKDAERICNFYLASL